MRINITQKHCCDQTTTRGAARTRIITAKTTATPQAKKRYDGINERSLEGALGGPSIKRKLHTLANLS